MTYNCTSTETCNAGPLGPSLADACSGSAFLAFMTILNTLVRKNEIISGSCERVVPVKTPKDEYDFVVVGGGAAGAVVAARLSEIHNWKVLLLEAGPDEPAGAEIPGFTTKFLETNIIWNYTTSNESHACLSTNGSCAWPSGQNLGGNTAHNGMIYLRGNPTDYNNWADQGNVGWTWEEVEKFFIKSEDNGEIERVGRKHHGTGGPLSVERFPYVPPISHAILEAADEVGYGVSEDLNGEIKSGVSIIQAANKNGVRRSSSRAFLWPIRNRTNLHVSLKSHATRLIIENGTAVGVEYFKDGELRTVYVTREVIVSGGVVESPHLLMLSGIGPEEHLESMDIDVVLDVPGVGENLHDHPCAILTFTVDEPDTYDNDIDIAAQYLTSQSGPLSGIGTVQVIGMLATNYTTRDFPDIELYFTGYLSNCAPGEVGARQSDGKRTIEVTPSYLHPKSRGRVTLKSNDPFEYPTIWVNYLGESEDRDGIVEGIRMTLDLLENVKDYNFTMTNAPLPACSDNDFGSYEYWSCVAQQANYPVYHQGGTCKMGPSSDPMAVVDPRLKVHGIKGLRVADNSIMPEVPSSNTAAPAIMIGERCAQFIKEDWN